MNQETFEKNYTMSSLHKAIKVLKAFTKEEPNLSLTELSKKQVLASPVYNVLFLPLCMKDFFIKMREQNATN